MAQRRALCATFKVKIRQQQNKNCDKRSTKKLNLQIQQIRWCLSIRTPPIRTTSQNTRGKFRLKGQNVFLTNVNTIN